MGKPSFGKYRAMLAVIVAIAGVSISDGSALSQYARRDSSQGGPPSAAAIQEADLAFAQIGRKDYASATPHLQSACDQGVKAACSNLALSYLLGRGVAIDAGRAAEMSSRLCNGGYSPSCSALGYQYANGKGVAKDVDQGIALFKRACAGQSGEGCLFLGMRYRTGNGIPQDQTLASRYLGLGCDYGNANACSELKNLGNVDLSPAQSLTLQVRQAVPLWALANGERISPGTLRVAMTSPTRVAGSYQYALSDGTSDSKQFEARIYAGQLCIYDTSMIAQVCAILPANEAEANRRYTIAVAKRAEANRELADVEVRGRGQTAGQEINAADAACMKTMTETYVDTVETGRCLSGYTVRSSGQNICNTKEYRTVQRDRKYEKNICSRPIRFRDRCGATILGSYSVKPGARFDAVLSYPCVRVY